MSYTSIKAAAKRSLPPRTPVATAINSPDAKPWQQRRHGQCTWPILADGVTLSCCSPVVRGSFCGPHAQVGYDTVRALDVNRTASFMTRSERTEG